MADQAIGFLLEFRNEASDDLREAHDDFTRATEALEQAVDAAQAAFTFLEEGTGSLAKMMAGSVDAVVQKTGELRTAIEQVGSAEVQAPDLDPIQQAIENLGEGIEAPIDAGIEEVTDSIDDLNDNVQNIEGPSLEEWIAFQETAKGAQDAIDDVTDSFQTTDSASVAYTRTLHDMSEQAMQTRSDLRKTFEGLDAKLAKTGKILFDDLTPKMEEFGEKGREAAAHIAGDTVAAYERLQESAGKFFEENAKAFSEANDVAEVWNGFIQAEETDIRKVQDLLRVADQATLEPLVENLVEQLGDAALAEEFWQPIAANKNVDREFFTSLRKQFVTEKRVYQTWWDRMGDTAQKFFWPVYEKQGKEAAEGITEFLASKLKGVFASPIGQFTAALQLSKLIDRVFGPALELLGEIIGQALLPLMRVLVDFMDESIRPAVLALTDALFPLFEALGEIMRAVGQGFLPVFTAVGTIMRALTPLIVAIAQIVGFVVNAVFTSFGEILTGIAETLEWTFDVFGDLFDIIMVVVRPVIDLIVWLDELTGVSKALGFVITVALIPAMVGYASTAIPAAIAAVGSYTTVLWKKIKATALAAKKTWTLGLTMLKNLVPALFTAVGTMWTWIGSLWAAVVPMVMGLIPALWGAVTATWAFTVALLANPLTWIVLAVAAAIAVLVGVIWLLWEPIKEVFGIFADWFAPVIDWVQQAVDWFGGWGNVILFILGPIGWLIKALEWIVDLFGWIFGAGEDSENTFSLGWITDGIEWLTDWVFGWLDWLPDWVKWLLGLDDAEVPEDAGPDEMAGVQDAKAMVEGVEEGAETEALDQPDWWKAMWGIDSTEATEEVAATATDSYEEVGAEATTALSGRGSTGFLGMMEEVGAMSGFFMLEGLAAGMFSVATAFPLSNLFSLMFGPFANVIAQPAATGAGQPPTMAGVNVGQVDYEVETDISGENLSDPVVRAIDNQTRTLQTAIANSGETGLDLDLQDLKDIAEF